MLERLLETGARTRKAGLGGTVSVIVHAAIIGFAIVKTGNAELPRKVVRDPIYIPIAAPIPDRAPGRQSGGGTAQSTAADRRSLPVLPVPGPVDFPIAVPAPTGAAIADTSILSEIRGSGGGPTSGNPGANSGAGVTSDNVVDTPVRVLSERVPLYPDALRSAGIAGSVTMQFVIDTLGRVESSSVRALASSHELFTRAVVAALRQARFTPGQVAGHRVRTLVERSFRFDLAGAR